MARKINFKKFISTVVLCAVTAVFFGCQSGAEQSSATAESSAAVLADAVSQSAESSLMGVPVYKDTDWMENGSVFAKYSIKFQNTLSAPISNWKINVYFSDNVTVTDSWNGSFSAAGRLVAITPESWNYTVNSGGYFDIGFIAKFDGSADIISTAIYQNDTKIHMDNQTEQSSQYSSESSDIDAVYYSPDEGTPVQQNGKLSVKGTQLVNQNGDPVILQGVSTHGLAWFPQYCNKDAFQTLRDTMNVDTIRLALYSGVNEGYSKQMHSKVDEGVKYASELGMYVIIDWHLLEDKNPNYDKENAVEFFKEMSAKYCDYDNVIYEICNEPNGNVTWSDDIKPYAVDVISAIRQNDDDAVIIVGTPTWSQDVDIAAADPLDGENIMYALHFYAGTHGQELRDKLEKAYSMGLPVFVSEFGITDASGYGNVSEDAADTWIKFLRNHGISYCCWCLSNKAEECSIIKTDCTKLSGWTDSDLKQQGLWIKKTYLISD